MASKNLTAGKKRGFGLYLDAAGIVLAVAGAGAVATVLLVVAAFLPAFKDAEPTD